MKKSIILLIFLWASVSFGAPALCSDSGATYDSLAFCESQCAESCTELVSSGGTCSSSYKNYIYDNSTNTTYALTQTAGTWTAFPSSAIVRNADINTLLKNILSYSGASSAWIGLYDPDKSQNLGSSDDTRFKWRDGSLLNYRNWATGQPDNAVNGGDIGNVAVYGEHWVLMNIDGAWSDTGKHAGQSMSYPALVEFSGQLGCVTGTMPTEKVEPDDMISSYCVDNPDKCYLCTDSTDIFQCVEGTSGGYLCPRTQATCDAQWANSSCGNGGVLNTTSDKCELARNVSCPVGMSYDSNLDRCVMSATCSNGGLLNGVTDLCEIVLGNGSCPSGYTYDATNNGCVKLPDCSTGTYNASTDRCEFAVTYNCPTGYTYNSARDTCEANPVCPSGSTYSTTANMCLTIYTQSCPSGYTFNAATNKCESSVTCPSGTTYDTSTNLCVQSSTCSGGGILNTGTDLCEVVITTGSCPSGYTYDATNNGCVKTPDCSAGTYNPSTDRCEFAVTYNCPSGYSYNSSTGICEANPVCPSGTSYNATYNTCMVSATLSCPSGYTLSGSTCISQPTCLTGAFNSSADRCESANGYNCSLGNSYSSASECTNNCSTSTQATVAPIYSCGYTLGPNLYVRSITSDCLCADIYVKDGTQNDDIIYEGNICRNQTVTLSNNYHTALTFGEDGSFTTNNRFLSYSTKIYTYISDYNYSCPAGYARYADYCVNTGTCSQGSCPAGTTASGTQCISSPVCSGGGVYNTSTNRCEISTTKDCISGTAYDSALNMCVSTPTCTSSGLLNTGTDKCTLNVSMSCPSGYTKSGNVCYSSPICSLGSYNATLNTCLLSTATLCPSGYTFNASTDKCELAPNCSTGSYNATLNVCSASAGCGQSGTVNTSLDVCQLDYTPTCASGYTYSPDLSRCVTSATCNNSGSLNIATDQCVISYSTSCPSGYTKSGNVCYSSPVCSSGTYDATLNTCILSAATLCPAGYIFNASTDKCELAPSCLTGSYSSTIGKCAQLPTITCAMDYTYNSSLKLCENNPTCSSGSYNTAQNKCLAGYACPYSGQPCVETNGQWKCSKYPCYNATDESNYASDDTTEGANDIIADGEQDDEGNCLGTIYIFNGNDNRCRKPGAQTGFSDCCKKKKDWLGLAKCNPKEQMLSSLRSWGKLDGQCHEVGEYCSEKWVGVCVQKKRTYCCFGSALARIITEQGRTQLDISWGNAKEPNCRGFTPEEFQKLDFSKISFQEWIEEYVVPELNENITNNIKETFENITLPTGVSQ